MRFHHFAALTLLFGCSASAEPETTPQGPAAALHGSAPAQALGLPEFSVSDQLGQARGPEDLKGRPHVLWFFPMAGTPG
jgi:cytochrome oxidase Cu insertion factor (SCO1/SenC/PrrC family)